MWLLSYAQPYFLHPWQGQWLPTYPRKWRTRRAQFLTSLLCSKRNCLFSLPTHSGSLPSCFSFFSSQRTFLFSCLFFFWLNLPVRSNHEEDAFSCLLEPGPSMVYFCVSSFSTACFSLPMNMHLPHPKHKHTFKHLTGPCRFCFPFLLSLFFLCYTSGERQLQQLGLLLSLLPDHKLVTFLVTQRIT